VLELVNSDVLGECSKSSGEPVFKLLNPRAVNYRIRCSKHHGLVICIATVLSLSGKMC
jgi:hypothetical protein